MRATTTRVDRIGAVFGAALVCSLGLLARPVHGGAIAPQAPPIETAGRIESVTVHDAWAVVTRIATIELDAGTHDVRFINLPESIEPASIRADAGARGVVTRVTYEVREDVASYQSGLAALEAAHAQAAGQLAVLDEKLLVIAKEEGLLDAIAERTAQRSGEQVGSGRIDLDEITRVSKYLAEQHAALLERRRTVTAERRALQTKVDRLAEQKVEYQSAGPPLIRSALIGLKIDQISDPAMPLRLTYLASGVSSRISYNVRTDPALSQAVLEFELAISQRTGENWDQVAFGYSTHPVIDPTAPPALNPGLLGSSGIEDSSLAVRQAGDEGVLSAGRASLARLVGQGGRVTSTGSLGSPPFALYRLPQPASIPSGGREAQRLRLNTFILKPQFRYICVPVLSNSAFLRGTIENSSRVHWLPGDVAVFLGSEYVGETTIPYVAPGSRVDVFFGTDHRVTAQRTRISHRTRSTGLLGDGRETIVEYRIRVGNATGQGVAVEVWDRSPITRDDRIVVSTTAISPAVSRDAEYRLRQRSTGLLRWDLDLPAAGRDTTLNYTLIVSHKSDVAVPDIPD